MDLLGHYNYWIAIVLAMVGFYTVIARGNLVKKIIGLNIFQASVFLIYITTGKVAGGTAPIITEKATLLSEFNGIATAFGARDGLLTEKAKSAVRSHAERQLSRNERQLSRDDLNVNLRNMYRGWNRRIEDETESKLAEIERRSGIRSSLETIGIAVLHPDAA